jgi:vanadium nitrogenase delta subunit
MDRKVDDLFDYVEERCLWQFHSRSQDRTRNINGVIAKAIDLLAGRQPEADTPADRCFVADAKVMVADFRARFPWIREAGEAEVTELLGGLRDRLIDLTVTRSRNRELNHSLY